MKEVVQSKARKWPNRVKHEKDVGREVYKDEKSIVDTRGYMPLEDRLFQLLQSGEQLSRVRTEMFEYTKELQKLEREEWPEMSPLQEGADLTDVHVETLGARERIAARLMAARLQSHKKAVKTAGSSKETPAEIAEDEERSDEAESDG